MYVKSILSISAFKPSELFSLLLTTTGGQVPRLPPNPIYVEPIPEAQPTWLPEYQYIAYAIVVIAGGLFLLYQLYTQSVKLDREMRLLIAVGLGAGVFAVLLVIRGYLYRSIIIWPLIMPLFLAVIDDKSPNTSVNKLFVLVIVGSLLISNFSILAAQPYFNQFQNTASISEKQSQGSEFAKRVPDGPIYTDLVHANEIVLDSPRKQVVVGYARSTGDSIAIGENIQPLYGQWGNKTGYSLVTEQGKIGVRTWWGAVPAADGVVNRRIDSRIYDNGNDAWFLSS
ncbi:hypothetical protein ELS19_19345 [Halogeometricum borinquense]|uniref:Uncharacterized protein n=1 Tax=Halogeometricum borinquense TaxID=60847 RepID=A0A482SZP7_9EURY|nr:hypothetical protein ELS19_19345 [Halogeometricum borinquense]